jgi:putative (di)nucleoside polyphosphate hydrolase
LPPSADLPYRPCVGVTLINPAGLIFAGERLDMPGAWQMPQGGIDEGEAPADAALRELAEETGVTPALVSLVAEAPGWLRYDLPPHLLGKVWGGKWRGQEQKWFLYRFLGADSDIRIDRPHPEFGRWRWIGADDLLASIVPFKRDVYAQVIAAFRPWLA